MIRDNLKKIKLLHLIPSLEIGGAERQLSLLAVEQARQGYTVIVAVRQKGYFYKVLKKNNVIVYILGDHKYLRFILLYKIIRLIKIYNPNIIQTWLLEMNIIGGIVSIIKNKIWVATERTNKKFYQTNEKFKNFIQEKIIFFSSVLVTNSKSSYLYWKNKFYKKNIFFINNCIDFNNLNKFKKKNFSNQKLRLLSVGRLVDSKGFIYLIKSIKEIPSSINLNLTIIGCGEQKKVLVELVNKLKLQRKIKFLSNNKNWHKQLKNSSALISMSRFEGQPNVLLEAAAANCPLVISDIPEHREIFDKKSVIFISLNDVKQLSEAILFLINKPNFAKKMSQFARSKIRNMTIKNQFADYDKIYMHLLKNLN
jgi:glycosyltransferase involved in cell wall biosynthesis